MGRKGSGVEVREKSIRIHFVFEGPQKETLRNAGGKPLLPTPANERAAHRLADAVKRALDSGTFTWDEYFPHSAKCKSKIPDTLGYVGQLWLQSKGQLTDNTLYQYEQALELWWEILGKQTFMKDLTYQVLAAKIGAYNWSSPKRQSNAMIPLRGVMDFHYIGPNSAHNPMQYLKNPKITKKLPDPLTAEERDKILADIRKNYDERVYAYFLWMFFTGMRPEEAIALKWSDIDENSASCRIQRVRTFKGSEREGTKTHAERDVDLVDEAMYALQIMKKYTFMKRTQQGEPVDVFENPVTKKPWHDDRSQRDHYFKPALRRAGVRYRRAYVTRHTFATIALMSEIKTAYIAQQLGHSVRVLLETYARWVPKADGGTEKERMRRAMASSNSSPVLPQESDTASNGLIPKEVTGRRNWIRTNAKRWPGIPGWVPT